MRLRNCRGGRQSGRILLLGGTIRGGHLRLHKAAACGTTYPTAYPGPKCISASRLAAPDPRRLCIDGTRAFLVDASFKDAAKSAPAALIEPTDSAAVSINQYETIWAAATLVRAP
jgi:hypothetical protein